MVTVTVTSGMLSGSEGNDILTGIAQNGFGQIHAYGKAGNDRINLDFSSIRSFSHGHHARGDDASTNRSSDVFNFQNLQNVRSVAVGRIEDFDSSRDTLAINGVNITAAQLALGAGTTSGYSWRIVQYDADATDSAVGTQQWILINTGTGYVFYSLEGARVTNGNGASNSGQQEAHFIGSDGRAQVTAAQLNALPTVGYIDPQNNVPAGFTAQGGLTINDEDNTYADALIQIVGSASGDLIAAGLNNDNVDAGDGNDVVWGGSGNDTLTGGIGNDTMWGGTDNDILFGGAGNDQLNGGSGNDLVQGDIGNDLLNGNLGNDDLRGDDGADTLNGQAGNDNLSGGAGNDILSGGEGNDRLSGGAGRDAATGGLGADVFVFRAGEMTDWDLTSGTVAARMAQMDVITDFVIGQDRIEFSGMPGVNAVSDFTVWRYTEGTNVYFAMNLVGTNERILVDVADNVTWAQFTSASNFLFT